jgi:osmotically inducible protein OsmC
VPRLTREATVTWEGNTARGIGTIASQSGALDGQGISLPSRLAANEGKTSPEELVAAAHAGCFAMSLSTELTQAGTPPGRLEVACTITLDERNGNHEIVASDIAIRASVAGVDDAAFQELVRKAHDGCTISALVGASAEISVDAALEG